MLSGIGCPEFRDANNKPALVSQSDTGLEKHYKRPEVKTPYAARTKVTTAQVGL